MAAINIVCNIATTSNINNQIGIYRYILQTAINLSLVKQLVNNADMIDCPQRHVMCSKWIRQISEGAKRSQRVTQPSQRWEEKSNQVVRNMKQWRKCNALYLMGSAMQTWKPDVGLVVGVAVASRKNLEWGGRGSVFSSNWFFQTKYTSYQEIFHTMQLQRMEGMKCTPILYLTGWWEFDTKFIGRDQWVGLSSSPCPKRVPFGKSYVLGYAECWPRKLNLWLQSC